MRSFILSVAVGFGSGVICFFISVAFLCFVLLLMGAVTHSRPDMTLTYKAAAPVAALAAMVGFGVTLVRSLRASRAGN